MNYSPLRYPGGKSKITSFVKLIIDKIGKENITYIEPFAGGCGIALSLLLQGYVKNIVINDYDKSVYSFWRAILNETDEFIKLIEDTPIDMEEWKKQKEIYTNKNHKYSLELGFALFYLNRTNRSGIINAGPIGGYMQNGNYLIDARYNKKELIKRIRAIAKNKSHIKIYNKESRKFIKEIIPQYESNAFVYFDPPYFKKGKELYKNFFTYEDHIELKEYITKEVNCSWIVTYDNVSEIKDLYQSYYRKEFDLNYSLANNGKGTEVIIFKDMNNCPTNEELKRNKLKIDMR